jgi:hypothetical protein
MSYDLMAFEPASAPTEREAFLAWFERLSQWSEERNYDQPLDATPGLQAWYQDMLKVFPAMNGPDFRESEINNPKITGYTCARDAIYVTFRWSEAKAAYKHVLAFARQHRIGFFDVSGNGSVWRPTSNGGYGAISG